MQYPQYYLAKIQLSSQTAEEKSRNLEKFFATLRGIVPTTLTSMAPAAIVSSIVEGTSRQLEITFGELESTFSELESTFSGMEGVSIKQETPISGVEGAWAGSCLLIRAHVTIGTIPRDIRYEPSYRKVRADDDGQHAAERDGFHKFWSSR